MWLLTCFIFILRFTAINEAYQILSKPEKKLWYDKDNAYRLAQVNDSQATVTTFQFPLIRFHYETTYGNASPDDYDHTGRKSYYPKDFKQPFELGEAGVFNSQANMRYILGTLGFIAFVIVARDMIMDGKADGKNYYPNEQQILRICIFSCLKICSWKNLIFARNKNAIVMN